MTAAWPPFFPKYPLLLGDCSWLPHERLDATPPISDGLVHANGNFGDTVSSARVINAWA